MTGLASTYGLALSALAIFIAGPSRAEDPIAAPAASGCLLAIESGSDQWIVPYDPFVDQAAGRQFDLAVVNRGDRPCAGIVGLDLKGQSFGLSRNGAGDRLAYAVVDERASSDITPRAGLNARGVGARPVTLAPGERTMLRFSVVVDPADLPDAGLYTQTAYLMVAQTDGVPLAERPVTVGVRVPTAALMGLKGEFRRQGSTATIDLGPLSESSRSLNTSLYVLSTSGYSIAISSTNAGRLRQGLTDWYVPYTISVGSETLDLSSARKLNVPSTSARSDDYPLSVNLGSVTGLRAGAYTDTVTFTVAAI